MKLTIVIPVFNTERTLRRCVESVLAQNYPDVEIILVDDGSPDTCPSICNDLAEANSKIRAIHQEHRGLGHARNIGIALAQGEYITFIDSDDSLAPQSLVELMKIIGSHPEYDLLEYPIAERIGHPKEEHLNRFSEQEYDEMEAYWLKGKVYCHAYACNKIYKRKLFEGIKYPEDRNFEDIATLPQLLRKCQKVATTSVGLYNYYYNEQGITAKATLRDLEALLQAHNQILLLWHDSEYYAHVLNIALDVYELSGRVPQLATLPYHDGLKLTLKRLIGFKNLCILHKIFRKIR